MNRSNVVKALDLLSRLGFPRAQVNDRSALTLLALAGIRQLDAFASAQAPLLGISR